MQMQFFQELEPSNKKSTILKISIEKRKSNCRRDYYYNLLKNNGRGY